MINPYLKEDREYPLITIKRQAEQLKAEGHDVIDLTIGDPQDQTFDGAVQTIQNFMAANRVSQFCALSRSGFKLGGTELSDRT